MKNICKIKGARELRANLQFDCAKSEKHHFCEWLSLYCLISKLIFAAHCQEPTNICHPDPQRSGRNGRPADDPLPTASTGANCQAKHYTRRAEANQCAENVSGRQLWRGGG